MPQPSQEELSQGVTRQSGKRGRDAAPGAHELLTKSVVQTLGGDAFAAVKTGGAVVTWGDLTCGGNSEAVKAELTQEVEHVIASQRAFAALKTGGAVVT